MKFKVGDNIIVNRDLNGVHKPGMVAKILVADESRGVYGTEWDFSFGGGNCGGKGKQGHCHDISSRDIERKCQLVRKVNDEWVRIADRGEYIYCETCKQYLCTINVDCLVGEHLLHSTRKITDEEYEKIETLNYIILK